MPSLPVSSITLHYQRNRESSQSCASSEKKLHLQPRNIGLSCTSYRDLDIQAPAGRNRRVRPQSLSAKCSVNLRVCSGEGRALAGCIQPCYPHYPCWRAVSVSNNRTLFPKLRPRFFSPWSLEQWSSSALHVTDPCKPVLFRSTSFAKHEIFRWFNRIVSGTFLQASLSYISMSISSRSSSRNSPWFLYHTLTLSPLESTIHP